MKDFIDYSFNKQKGKPLSQEIAHYIMKKIFMGEFPQGSRLTENTIAEELDVSNIPVREAFFILENTKIIERIPRKGVRVKSISEKVMEDYTQALTEIFNIGVNYSIGKWSDEKYQILMNRFSVASKFLENKEIIDFAMQCDYTCRYIFEVANNEAFLNFYTQITYITNAYSQVKWKKEENLKNREDLLSTAVDAIINEQYEEAKMSLRDLSLKTFFI
jgi:DNA-binding GntR family transcriptional regulator